jgi:preprotein translocase subunit YajC
MRSILGSVAGVLLLGAGALASAQSMETGTIVRVDPTSRVIMLEDGRMYRVTPQTTLLVDNQQAQLATLAPGQRVVIQSGEGVTLQNGQYVPMPSAMVSPAPGTTVVTQAPAGSSAPGTTVVTQAPSPAPAAAVPVGLKQTFYGVVTDVDKNGDVKIKTQKDSFEIRVAPEALRQVKKGDAVTLDLTIAPPGTPAASPSTR